MYAPRVKFEPIYIISPIKVAIVFLTSLHSLALFITLLTSFWIETQANYHGPLFSCKKLYIHENFTIILASMECYFGGFIYDKDLLLIPLTACLIILSFILSIIAIFTANFSFRKSTSSTRYRLWLCTILLLLSICLIDCFILIFVPLSYHHQIYSLQWAYGLHSGVTLFIIVSLIAAILTHNTDDIQYIETIDDTANEK